MMRRLLAWGVLPFIVSLSNPASAQNAANARSATAPIVLGVSPRGATRGSTCSWTLTGRGLDKAKQLIGLGEGVEVVDFTSAGETTAQVTVRVSPSAPLGYREIRVEGPTGISNLALVRIDSLSQENEVEPNDDPAQAQQVKPGTAVCGILKPTDVDYFRVKGTPGQRLTIDLEARRLGVSFSPVVTALAASGRSLAQGREQPGGDRDCRFGVIIPKDGIVFVSVRDNTYAGNDLASYRLRIDTAPYASGLFPLGGPKGRLVDVEVSGGTLPKPRRKRIKLPDALTPAFDLGAFEGPEGVVLAPMRFVVGDENEVVEPAAGSTSTAPMSIEVGQTVNGRIGIPGEFDRYKIKGKKGEKLRLRIQASELGSWIDSVLILRDAKERQLAENDDQGVAGGAQQGQRVNALGLTEGSQDSLLEYTPTTDGDLFIDVFDRYGDGGPEYPYRLAVGRTHPDLNLTLLLGNPNANINQQGLANARFAPGLMGVWNLKPGTVAPINFLLKVEGDVDKISVGAEGLPPGVTVEPVKLSMAGSGRPNDPAPRSQADSVVLRVNGYADPGVANIRIVASGETKRGEKIVRYGTAIVGLQQVNAGGQALPITRTLSEFPLRVLGERRMRLVGPPLPPQLLAVVVPGVLLQGDRLDLQLDFDQSPLADPGFQFEALAEGVGLATNTVISSGLSAEDEDEIKSDVLVRVLASPRAQPGVYPVKIKATFSGGRTQEQSASVIVRRPLEVLVRDEVLTLKPGGSVSLPIAVRRESGANVEVEFKVDGLPRGVKLTEALTLAEDQNEGVLRFEMAANARPVRTPREITIAAVARMPRGAVTIEAAIHPRIVAPPAEE